MNRHLQGARHLVGAGDQLAKMAALLEQLLRMRLLKIAGADFRRWNLRRDSQHRHARAVAVEQAVDEMQIARSAAAGADRELTREMGLATGGKRRDLLVPDMNPFDLALAAERVGQPIETVANDAVDPFDSGRDENFGKLIRYRLRHHPSPFLALNTKTGQRSPHQIDGHTFSRCSTAAVSARMRRDSAASSIRDSP